jgi:hypothetical protein
MRMAFAIAVCVATAGTAMADTGPVMVIPSRAGVPIVINGVDASFAIVEGDWGLGKSVHVQPTVYFGWPLQPPPPAGHYFPREGQRPGYGRYEVNTPPRRLPQAESYERSWGAESPRGFEQIPTQPPPIIYAPEYRGRYPRPR